MGSENRISHIIPVMLTFFTMGFVDLVGIATNYVKQDFGLSDTAANSFSVMVFFWFLVFSVPTGMLMNKIGRKKTVLLSMVITFIGLLIPIFVYNDVAMFFVFSCLGIGNTLMQVSLNPLLANMVCKDRLPSYLTLGQFIKAIASFIAPLIAVHAALCYGDWKLLFYIFAAIDIIAIVYLFMMDIVEAEEKNESSSFKECIKLLQEKVGMSLAEAGYATSLYFLFRTFGCLSGTFIMAKFSPLKFFVVSVAMIFIGISCLYISMDSMSIYICVALIGVGNSNIFSIIFSKALLYMPSRNNEISGLMIMGIFGGAIFPVFMGFMSDIFGGQIGAVVVLTVCVIYLLFLMIRIKNIELE